MPELHAVTGALGFTGRHIAARLLARGARVRTLTGHPGRENPFGERLEIAPLDFADPAGLRESLRGATTLFNTYWIRFPRGPLTYEVAVENSRRLFAAAREAGVRRIVHVSITHPAADSPLGYFRGKAQVEEALRESGVAHAILRPTMLFGDQGLLLNNLAWLLRRLPAFAVPDGGHYRVQPVFVEDLADLAVEAAQGKENLTREALGPEVFSFAELLRLLAGAVGSRALLAAAPAALTLPLTWGLGLLLRDVLLTPEELRGLRMNLLVGEGPATCPTRLTEWLQEHGEGLGRRYLSEVAWHYR